LRGFLGGESANAGSGDSVATSGCDARFPGQRV
jgi:hypothetical protein